ncbi:MAG: phosphoribosylanthranilate isomerase [Elusimicrobiota bacterium]|jgi:phosphoribosylanthranilate isomerase|nr:phosphoribosylanthranilate isomerase [Elusimicrobiota bacterium]
MAKIKICGLANYNDSLDATNLGADFLGFHFIKESPKKVSDKMVKDIVSKLPPFVIAVGVFENEDKKTIDKTLKKTDLKAVQLNGVESAEFCGAFKNEGIKVFKFFKLDEDESWILRLQDYVGKVDYLVLDISFGQGEEIKHNFDLAQKAANVGIPFFISGKIGESGIKSALEKVIPFGFDIDSDIERLPKRKDYEKMLRVIKLAHGLKI